MYKPAFRRLEREERTVKKRTVFPHFSHALTAHTGNASMSLVVTLMNLLKLSSYVTFCVDLVIPTKKVVIYPNNKPWVTKEFKCVINKKKQSFDSGDLMEMKAASREVKNETRKAKTLYRKKIEKNIVLVT